MPSPPAFVEIRNNLSLYQQHQNHQNHQLSYRIILCHIIYRIISYPIVDLKWQNRLRVGTDKSMQKVKMQSVSDDDDVRKRFLEKPRSEPAAKGVFRLGRWYTLRQGVPGFLVSNRESTATNGCFTCLCATLSATTSATLSATTHLTIQWTTSSCHRHCSSAIRAKYNNKYKSK